MYILKVKFYRDFESMRKMLTSGEFTIYRIKSKIIMSMLRAGYKSKDISEFSKPEKDGFIVNVEKETEVDIKDQEEQLKDLMFDSKVPQGLDKLKRERFFVMMRRKFKTFNLKLFMKASQDNNIIGLLNLAGIMVSWKVVNGKN